MDDPQTWTGDQMEAWLAKDAEARLRDLRELQEAAFAIKPTAFNRRKWTDAATRFTRLVLLEVRANARATADAYAAAIEAGRIDSETRALLDQKGPEVIETLVAVAFTQIEEAFERHDWSGSGVSSPEQATRLMFVGERVEQAATRSVEAEGLTKESLPALKGFVSRQLETAFSTPAGQPLPTS